MLHFPIDDFDDFYILLPCPSLNSPIASISIESQGTTLARRSSLGAPCLVPPSDYSNMLIQSSSEASSSPRLIDPALLSTTPDLVLPHSAVTFDRNVSAADWSAGTSAGQKRPRLSQAEETAVSIYANAQFALTWSPSDVDFSDLAGKIVTKSHCFAMGEQSRDYFGSEC